MSLPDATSCDKFAKRLVHNYTIYDPNLRLAISVEQKRIPAIALAARTYETETNTKTIVERTDCSLSHMSRQAILLQLKM